VPGTRKLDIGVGPPGTGELSSRDQFEQVAKETFASLLTELQTRGKRVVYVKHNAPLSFDPEACVARRWAEPKKSRCVEPLQTYQESGRDYYPMVDEVLRRFPEVRVLELTSVLCDGRECTAMRDGKMLYRDFAHLSIDGSIAVGPALSRLMH